MYVTPRRTARGATKRRQHPSHLDTHQFSTAASPSSSYILSPAAHSVQFTVALNYIHPFDEKNAAVGVHMSTNTVISNQNERKKLPLEKQTNIHAIHLMNSQENIYRNIHIHTNTYVCLSCYTHKKIALCTLLYRLDQLCIRRLLTKKNITTIIAIYYYLLLLFPPKSIKKLLS